MLCCLALMSVLVAGCGDSDDASTTNAATTGTTTPARTTAEPAVLENTFERPKSPGPHPGAKVDRLIIKDIVKGDGPEVRVGDTAVVEFVLSDWNSGKEIDASWGKKRPYETQIEHNVVIEGWVQGVAGMRVGGRRALVIPPALGFLNNPNPKVADKTTYFDIVLLGVRRAKPAGLGGQAPATPESAARITEG